MKDNRPKFWDRSERTTNAKGNGQMTKKLGYGEREVLEHIVKTFSDYQTRMCKNETVHDWVEKAKQKLKDNE